MARRRWNFSVLQLLLLTALCGLCAGVVATSRQVVHDYERDYFQFSSDGRWLLEYYRDGRLHVWDLQRRRRLYARARLPGNDAASDLSGPKLIDQDKLVLLRHFDTPELRSELLLWDIRRNQTTRLFPVSPWYEDYTVSRTGNFVAFAISSASPERDRWGTIEVRNLVSGELRRTLVTKFHDVRMTLSSDGKTLAVVPRSIDARSHVQIWNTDTGMSRVLRVPLRAPFVSISGDGRHLVCWALEGFVIWDIAADRQVGSLGTLYDLLWIPSFSGDGQWVFLGPIGRPVELRDADGSEVAGFSGSELANARKISLAAVSPDRRWIVTTSFDGRLSVWDGQTFAHVGDLYRDRRGWAAVGYILGFVVWAAAWGWHSRRQRASEKGRPQRVEDAKQPLPKIVRMGLHPRQAWNRILLLALGFGIALGWVFGNDFQRFWGWSYSVTLLALVPTFFVGFLLVVLGIALGVLVLPPTVRRWRGVPYLAGIARAERSASVPGRRIRWGPVTACFVGRAHLEATLVEDFEAVRRHFERSFGAAISPGRPLTVLVFEQVEWYDLHLDGHLPVAGVYWMGIDRQVMICEELCLRWMTEPRWIWRQLLARYFFEQHKGLPPPSNVASVLAHSLLCELDPYLTRRTHRRAKTMLCRGDSDSAGMVASLNLPDRQLLAAMLDPQHQSHLTVNRFSTACSSLAEYLMGDAAGERAERFRCLLRQWRRRDSLGDRLQQHSGMDAAALEQDWRHWISEQPTEPSGRPSATIQRYFHTGVLPQIVDARAPLEERLRLIRHLGASGYELGIDALIGLLQDRRAAELHPDVVWALESISGEPHGADIATWQTWWSERRTQLGRQPGAESVADEADVFVAALADEDSQPMTAELADSGGTSFPAQESVDDGSTPKPALQQDDGPSQDALALPRRLKFLWVLLWLGGLIAVGWSVYLTLYWGEELLYASLFGSLVGAFAMTRGTGSETQCLTAAAGLLMLCIMLLNVPSCLLGLVAAWQLRHPRIRQYIRRA